MRHGNRSGSELGAWNWRESLIVRWKMRESIIELRHMVLRKRRQLVWEGLRVSVEGFGIGRSIGSRDLVIDVLTRMAQS